MPAFLSRKRAVFAVLVCAACGLAQAQSSKPVATAPPHNFTRWEADIQAFEAADKLKPPPKNAILFVGSSTIVRWKTLQQDYPAHPIINRGFGGNEIADTTYYADRIIFPYQPRLIFLRAGGNDIHNGRSPEEVFNDFKEFVAKVHSRLPRTEIVFISYSPAIARWDERDAGKKLNALIDEYIKHTRHLKYIETYDLPLDAKGEARPELFVEDKLHFSPEGYKLLAERVRPHMPR